MRPIILPRPEHRPHGAPIAPTKTQAAVPDERSLMLDMWVIFVNISPVIGPVIHEERKAPACRQRSRLLLELFTHWTGKKLRGVAAETVHACSSGLVPAWLVPGGLLAGGLLAGGLAPGALAPCGVVPGLVPPCTVGLSRFLRLGCSR